MLQPTLCLAAFAALSVASLAMAEEPLAHAKDAAADVMKNVAAWKAVIVDVRELNEWKEGHLKGAIHAPKSELDDEATRAAQLKKLPKDKIIYMHCQAGGRALDCGELLKEAGYDVRPLKLGFAELVEGGLEAEKK
jgi:phage shock protein E